MKNAQLINTIVDELKTAVNSHIEFEGVDKNAVVGILKEIFSQECNSNETLEQSVAWELHQMINNWLEREGLTNFEKQVVIESVL